MIVTNLRLGFATNSSSTHSVVLGPGPYQASAISNERVDFEFGWDDFVLDTAASKAAYLAAAVSHSLKLPAYQIKPVMTELFAGTALTDHLSSAYEGFYSGPYIDHQSGFTLPDPQRDNFPALVREALEFFADQRVTVYGGNDNDEGGFSGPITIGDEGWPIRIRRDGNNYVLFNWRSGAKSRFAPEGSLYGKAIKPELVDLKITDACPYRCDFCYQSSTPQGREADPLLLNEIIQSLGIRGLGVFEIALGGGEPTAYERFESVIRQCRDEYIKPNFTTFAVDWLLDGSKVKAANLCGGIGVSVHSKKDISKVERIVDRVDGPTVVGQHVYGTLPAEATVELIQEFNKRKMPLLLLGYKKVGFGADHAPHKMDGVVSTKKWPYLSAHDLSSFRLSVDTSFVNQHPEFLEFVSANKKTVSRTEGAFSMYIDGVAGMMGPSSYCDTSQMTKLPSTDRRGYRDGPNGALLAAISSSFATYETEAIW